MSPISSTKACFAPRSPRPLAPSTPTTSSARMRCSKAASRAARSCWRDGSSLLRLRGRLDRLPIELFSERQGLHLGNAAVGQAEQRLLAELDHQRARLL